MTDLELITKHNDDTKYCNTSNHMIECSSTYSAIMARGREIVPEILKYMVANQDTAGMSIMLLLWNLLPDVNPYTPEDIKGAEDSPIKGYNVQSAQQAWIEWGRREKLIT